MDDRDRIPIQNRAGFEQDSTPRTGNTTGQNLFALGAVFLGALCIVLLISAYAGKSKSAVEHASKDAAPRKTPGAEGSRPTEAASDSSTYARSITWRRSLDRAIEEAGSDKKIIVVDVYTTWCGWCRKMDENIYSSPQVAALSRNVVFVKLDAEDGGEGEQFAHKAGVRGYPTTVILNGSGRVIDSRPGYIQSPSAFVSYVESVRGAG